MSDLIFRNRASEPRHLLLMGLKGRSIVGEGELRRLLGLSSFLQSSTRKDQWIFPDLP